MIDSEKIQAFLSVVQYGNITNAANAVFTTQSHLSKQLRSLEEEVGTQLILRSKGHSEISLTPQGKEFLAIARKWEGIMDDFNQVRYTTSVTCKMQNNFVGFVENKFVGKPTFLFSTFVRLFLIQ